MNKVTHAYTRVDCSDFTHVLLGSLHKLVVDDPLWLSVVQRAGGVDVHSLLVNLRLEALLHHSTTASAKCAKTCHNMYTPEDLSWQHVGRNHCRWHAARACMRVHSSQCQACG